MPRANVRKNTVIHDELKIVGKSGIYCFLPYETIDKVSKKAVFKIGMTTRDFADRIEDYHTYYPLGVYMVFLLTYEKMRGFSRLSAAEKKTKKKVLEEAVMEAVRDSGGQRMQFHSRPGRTGVAPRSEWVYASYAQIEQAFEKVQTDNGGVLHKGHLDDINETYALNKKAKNIYEAKILYTVEV